MPEREDSQEHAIAIAVLQVKLDTLAEAVERVVDELQKLSSWRHYVLGIAAASGVVAGAVFHLLMR